MKSDTSQTSRTTAFCLVVALWTLDVFPHSAADNTFHKVKLLVEVGEKIEEASAILTLTSSQLQIRSAEGDVALKTFSYRQIKEMTYSYSKHPRWKSGAGVAAVVGVFALPVFFMKGKKHWLTVQTRNDYAVLRLDKANYKVIIPAVEVRTGKKVAYEGEEK